MWVAYVVACVVAMTWLWAGDFFRTYFVPFLHCNLLILGLFRFFRFFRSYTASFTRNTAILTPL